MGERAVANYVIKTGNLTKHVCTITQILNFKITRKHCAYKIFNITRFKRIIMRYSGIRAIIIVNRKIRETLMMKTRIRISLLKNSARLKAIR